MGRDHFDERERRGYRRRFPMAGLPDHVGREIVQGFSGTAFRGAGGESRDLAVLTGYGRGTESLAVALDDAGLRVRTSETYAPALDAIEDFRPVLILAGQAQGAGDLLHFLSRAGRLGSEAVMLVLADRSDPGLVNEALEHGAHDLVCPPHSVASILLRLHVSRRKFQERPGPERNPARRLSLGHLTVDLTTRQVRDGQHSVSLSGRESELLVRLMEAGGRVVSREDLLKDIWGSDQGSTAVLDATVHRLRKKLEEDLRESDLVATVRGVGYRLDPGTLAHEGAAAD